MEEVIEKVDNIESNKNLKNTIELDSGFYNINAVEADVAKKTHAALALEPSFGSRTDLEDKYKGSFNGNEDKAIKYVPSDGGKFTGVVHVYDNDRGYGLGSEDNPMEDSEILNYKQIDTLVSNLKGNPLWQWDSSDSGYTPITGGYQDAKIYGLNTVIGSVEDLPVFEAYSNGQAHNLYVTPDSYDNAYITYGSTYKDAYFNPAYKDEATKNSITKLVFKGTLATENDKVKIRGDEFYNMPNLTSVHLNPGVIELGTRAFSKCPRLSSIAIPDSLEIVGKEAFKECTGLTSIVLGSNIKEIKAAAFSGCENLKSIAICNNAVTIASDAFSGCKSLKTVYFKKVKNGKEWDNNLTNTTETGATANANVVPIDSTAFPFLYICTGPKGEDTSLTSNKMFLKIPNEPLVEISKGAARLERRDSKTSGNVDYFTYDVLAAVIAGINSRITALGSQALALPKQLEIYDTEAKQTVVLDVPVNIAAAEEDKAITVKEIVAPTVFELQDQVTRLTGGTYTDTLVPSNFSDACISNYDFSGKTLKFSNIKAGVTAEKNICVNYKIAFANGLIEGTVIASSEVLEDDTVVLSNSGSLKVGDKEVSSYNLSEAIELPDDIGVITDLSIKLSTEAEYTVVSADKFDEYVRIDFEVENAEDKEYIDTVLKAKADEDNVNINTGYYRKASNEFTGNNVSANTITISKNIPTDSTPGQIGDIMIVINAGDGE